MVRDILVRQIPTVLRAELYAVTALAGAVVVVAGYMLELPSALFTVSGAALCFILRFLAIWRGWQLPVATPPKSGPAASKTVSTNADPPDD
jgi:uncharacterized membrane protein YeiH